MPHSRFFSLLALFTVASPAFAAPAPLAGDWHAACDAWGTPAHCTSSWGPGLHESHVVQTYTITRAEDGVQLFAGRGLYRIVDGEVDGIWADSRGQILDLAGRYDAGVLDVIWGEARSEIGRSVYRFEAGGLQVRDSVLTDQGWQTFMQVDYPAPEAASDD